MTNPETEHSVPEARPQVAADTLDTAALSPKLPSHCKQRSLHVASAMSASLLMPVRDISVFDVGGSAGKTRFIAMDASPNGQFIGLYSTILERRLADPDFYKVELDGHLVDPLSKCDRLAYVAMIADCRARGVRFLPDSLALNQQNGHVWTATMLTGEPFPNPTSIWIASSSSGSKVNFNEHPMNRGGRSFRVRPALYIDAVDVA